jgi:hypothetical protein
VQQLFSLQENAGLLPVPCATALDLPADDADVCLLNNVYLGTFFASECLLPVPFATAQLTMLMFVYQPFHCQCRK